MSKRQNIEEAKHRKKNVERHNVEGKTSKSKRRKDKMSKLKKSKKKISKVQNVENFLICTKEKIWLIHIAYSLSYIIVDKFLRKCTHVNFSFLSSRVTWILARTFGSTRNLMIVKVNHLHFALGRKSGQKFWPPFVIASTTVFIFASWMFYLSIRPYTYF
jgi:flagellar biogenesis protein FliO